MTVLALCGVPIAMLNIVNQGTALLLVQGADYLSAVPADQLHAQAMVYLRANGMGNVIAAIFWGLWLFPLGLLVYRSGFFPRFIGILLMAGCFGWLAVVVQRLLLPGMEGLANARYLAHIAELTWILWLIARGVDRSAWERWFRTQG